MDTWQLESLGVLLVWNNRLVALPDEIGALASARRIEAASNFLEAVPDSIGARAEGRATSGRRERRRVR